MRRVAEALPAVRNSQRPVALGDHSNCVIAVSDRGSAPLESGRKSFYCRDLAGDQGGFTLANHELEWRMLGACRGLDASLFYPDEDDTADEAKLVCEHCSVRVACLDYALANREKVGVWGGATERERRRLLRQRRRTA